MRNIRQYPVTANEVNHELQSIQVDTSDIEKINIGDLGPMILQHIQVFFSDKENMDKLLEQMRIK